VPKGWNISGTPVSLILRGRRVIDFTKSNLHGVGYSVTVRTRMHLAALREHLHTLPEQPDLVPYRTSYYKEAWGFCLSQNALAILWSLGVKHLS
jgi:aminopeptidase-like protein